MRYTRREYHFVASIFMVFLLFTNIVSFHLITASFYILYTLSLLERTYRFVYASSIFHIIVVLIFPQGFRKRVIIKTSQLFPKYMWCSLGWWWCHSTCFGGLGIYIPYFSCLRLLRLLTLFLDNPWYFKLCLMDWG